MRVPVQYCPYCGEQDLRPRESPEGALPGELWECADCRATFQVTRATQPEPARGRS